MHLKFVIEKRGKNNPLCPIVVLAVCSALACEVEDVGVPCKTSLQAINHADTSWPKVNARANDCRSRLCIRFGPEQQGLCTRACETADDCPDATPACEQGFSCAVGVATEGAGPTCCKLCICRSALADPEQDSDALFCQDRQPRCPSF